MPGEAEQLVVSLEARVRQFEQAFQRAQRVSNDNWRQIEGRARTGARNLESAMASSTSGMSRQLDNFGSLAAGKLKGAFAAITAGVGLNELRRAADQYTGIMNTLKAAGVKDADLGSTFDKLFASAQRNYAPIDALATLYGRVSQAQTALKASSSELLRFTDVTAQSLRVSGTSAAQAQGALLQLGQALAGGKIQSEEFNSLIDGMRPLLQAAAAGLVEAGGDVAQLSKLVKDGEVSSEAFFRAILAGAPVLEEKLAGAVTTTGQALTNLQNEMIKAVGEFDKATGASAALAGGIDRLTGSISGIGSAATSAVVGVQQLIGKVAELAAANMAAQRAQGLSYQAERAARTDAAREMGLANSGGREKLAADNAAADSAAAARRRAAVASFRQSEIADANRMTTTVMPPPRPSGAGAAIRPVSLASYPVSGDDKGGKGGGGGGSGAEKQSRYDREVESIARRTEALQREAEMVGRGKREVEQSKIALQLEQAAKRDGITISDQMRTAIDSAASGYAAAKMRVEDLKTAFEGTRDAAKFFGTEITDGLIDVIVEGKSAQEVIQGLGKAMLKAALQGALMGSGPFGKLFGGGLFGMVFGGIGLADGGYISGPGTSRSDSIPARLSNGEFVVNARATAQNRDLLQAINAGGLPAFSDGGFVGAIPQGAPALPSVGDIPANNSTAVTQQVNVTVNAQGGDPKQNRDLADQIGRTVQQQLRGMIGAELKQQIRPGGLLKEAAR